MSCPHFPVLQPDWRYCPICGKRLFDLEITSAFILPNGTAIALLQNNGIAEFPLCFLENFIVADTIKDTGIVEGVSPGTKTAVILKSEFNNILVRINGDEDYIPTVKPKRIQYPKLQIAGAFQSKLYLNIGKVVATKFQISTNIDLPIRLKLPDELMPYLKILSSNQEIDCKDGFMSIEWINTDKMVFTFVIGNSAMQAVFVPIDNFIDVADTNYICLSDAECYSEKPITHPLRIKSNKNSVKIQSNKKWLSSKPSEISSGVFELSLFMDTEQLQKYPDSVVYLTFKSKEAIQVAPIRFNWTERTDDNAVLGIDLGTSNSCLAYRVADEIKSFQFPFEPRVGELASAVRFKRFENKEYDFGELAKEYYFVDPYQVSVNFKPRLTSEKSEKYRDSQNVLADINPFDVTRIYCKQLIREFFSRMPYKPENTRLYFTHPADHIDTNFRAKLYELWRGLDFNIGDVISGPPEPVALAYAYIFAQKVIQKPGFYAIFDFGGFTTDLCFFTITQCEDEPVFDVIYSTKIIIDGISMGGEFLTFLLSKHLADQISSKLPFPKSYLNIHESDRASRENYAKLSRIAELFKITGKTIGTAELTLKDNVFSDIDVTIEPDESELAGIITQFIQRGINQISDFLTKIRENISTSDKKIQKTRKDVLKQVINSSPPFAAILLGGNSSRHVEVMRIFEESKLAEAIIFDEDVAKIGVSEGLLHWDKGYVDIRKQYAPFTVAKAKMARFEPIFHWGEPISIDGDFREVKLKTSAGRARLYITTGADLQHKSRSPDMEEIEITGSGIMNLFVGFETRDDELGIGLRFVVTDKDTGEICYQKDI